jgi:hypothetical protein
MAKERSSWTTGMMELPAFASFRAVNKSRDVGVEWFVFEAESPVTVAPNISL